MLPAGRRPPDEQPDDAMPVDHHEVWDQLLANRSAVCSWDRRFHRTTLSALASTDGPGELSRALCRSPED